MSSDVNAAAAAAVVLTTASVSLLSLLLLLMLLLLLCLLPYPGFLVFATYYRNILKRLVFSKFKSPDVRPVPPFFS